MCQTIAQVLAPRIDGLYSIVLVLVLGVIYGAILLFQFLLGAGLVAIALQRRGARLVRRVRAAFARPSTASGALR
jgi:hypothetical protein